MPSKLTGFERLWKACGYSLQGLRAAWRHEAAFRQELTLAILLLPAAWWLARGALEFALLVATLLLVLVVELLNSSIEAIVDRVGMERHELSGRAKDLGSAAVLLSLVLLAVVWGAIAWVRFDVG
ncbi:MAG TPA: diacylglycerol kinase [Gammaproteobacteria bacterium]|nr:diacylglycerol kinase [Gammaproteobacteria bacterium]